MNVTLEIWQFILLIITFLGAMAAVGKLLLEQVLVRMDNKFKAQGEAAIGFQSSLSKRLDGLEQSSRAEREQWRSCADSSSPVRRYTSADVAKDRKSVV